MSMTHTSATSRGELELATFYVGGLLMGADIRQVEEINRLLDVTPVPRAPDFVVGVLNLRGEVVTVLDLGRILGMDATEIGAETRNVIVNSQDEQVGLVADRIGDVVTIPATKVDPLPANFSGPEGRFFQGVCMLDAGLLMVLDVEAVLNVEAEAC